MIIVFSYTTTYHKDRLFQLPGSTQSASDLTTTSVHLKMSTSHQIRHIRITPIAFRDPPLLNAAGIHEPWALRSIIEIETASGLVGINESYGDLPMLEALAKVAPALVGLSP